MEIRLLGPLECVGGGGPVEIHGTSAKAVLCMFALRPGEVVRTDELVEGLWGANFPLDPTATVHVTISRLRRALGADRERLQRVTLGYVLDVDPMRVDAARVQASLTEGRSLLGLHRTADALETLRPALDAWRSDSPLAEFADLPFAVAAASRLHLLRCELVEAANEAALVEGRPEEVVKRSEHLLAADPWREGLVGQLMVALYQTGCQAEALVTYSELASRLRADFGVAPSPALAEIRSRVMSHDPTLRRADARTGTDSEVLPRWFQTVLDDLGEGEDDPDLRCRLRLALGEAQHYAGLPGWQDTLLDAADLAQHTGDPALVAKCALAGALGWSVTPGEADERRLRLLSSALDAAASDDELRARLLAAYANELSFTADLQARMHYSEQAIALARASGNPALLLAILNQRFNAIWAPETLTMRVRESAEASLIAEASQHLMAQAVASGFAMAASLESGDMETTDRHLSRFTELARELDLPVFGWGAKLHAGWRAVLAGDLEDADRLCETALRLGTEASRPEAHVVYMSQRMAIRWAQGRMSEEVESLEELCAAVPALPGLRAAYALAVYHDRDIAAARSLLVGAWSNGSIETLPHDQVYLASLMLWGELASALGDAEVCGGLFVMLEPYRDRFCFTGSSVYGPVAHVLGLLATTTGNPTAAHESFHRSACLSRDMHSAFFAERSEKAMEEASTRSS